MIYIKVNYKILVTSILIPVILGSIVGYLTASSNNYYELNLPSFAPPGILFPIVWTILYILMGISYYIIVTSNSHDRDDALLVYKIQLVINLLWCFWFFTFKFYLFSFIWILLLITFALIMIKKFYDISKVSAYLQIPYLLWLIFAGVLNLFVYFSNM